jgi:hypothetical protein
MIREWVDRIICRYFGHRWGDWKYFTRCICGDVTNGWPMKSRKCSRCGEVDERDDMPQPVNCRCWVAHPDERTKAGGEE